MTKTLGGINTPENVVQEAVSAALADQSWFVRRKDTMAAAAAAIAQFGNLALAVHDQLPPIGAAIVAVVILVAQIVVHAATPGAITPSMSYRLNGALEEAHAHAAEVQAKEDAAKAEEEGERGEVAQEPPKRPSLPVYRL